MIRIYAQNLILDGIYEPWFIGKRIYACCAWPRVWTDVSTGVQRSGTTRAYMTACEVMENADPDTANGIDALLDFACRPGPRDACIAALRQAISERVARPPEPPPKVSADELRWDFRPEDWREPAAPERYLEEARLLPDDHPEKEARIEICEQRIAWTKMTRKQRLKKFLE